MPISAAAGVDIDVEAAIAISTARAMERKFIHYPLWAMSVPYGVRIPWNIALTDSPQARKRKLDKKEIVDFICVMTAINDRRIAPIFYVVCYIHGASPRSRAWIGGI